MEDIQAFLTPGGDCAISPFIEMAQFPLLP
jgi:hypothetical protein